MALRGYYKLAEGLQFLNDPEVIALEFRGVTQKQKRFSEDGKPLPQPVQDFDANGQPKWLMKTLVIKQNDEGEEFDSGELTWTIVGEKPSFKRAAMIQPVGSALIGCWPQSSGSAAYLSLSASDFEEIEI